MAQLRIPLNFFPTMPLLTFILVFSVPALYQAADKQFNCPEQFGYYPDTDDCSKYFVCVFGDALHESCTGGLYFSVELQTCDWPRNVECANGYKPPVPKEAPAPAKDDSFSANRRNPPSNANKARGTRPLSTSQGRSAGNQQNSNSRPRYEGEGDFDSSRNGPARNVPQQDPRTTLRTTNLPRTTSNTLPATTPLPSTVDSDLPTLPVTTTALQVYKDTPDYESGTTDTTTPSNNSPKDSLDSLEDAGADPPNNRFPGYDPQQPQFEEAVPSVVDSEGRIHIPDGLYSNGPNLPGVSDISVFVKPIYENDERDENDRKNNNNDDDARHRKPAIESSPYVTPIYSNNGGSRDHDADRIIPSFRIEEHHDEDEISDNDKTAGRNPIPEINSNNGNHKEPEEEVNRFYRTSGSQDGRDPRDRSTTVVQVYNPRENGPYPRIQNTHNFDNRPVVRYSNPKPEVYEETPTVYRDTAPAPASSYRDQTTGTGNHYGEVPPPQLQPQGRPAAGRELNLREPVAARDIVVVREEPIREPAREISYREQAPPRAVFEDTAIVRETPNRGPSYRNQPDQIRRRTTTTTTTTTTPKPIIEPVQLNREGSRYSTSNRNRNNYRSQDRNRQPNKEIPLQYVSTRHRQNPNQQPNYGFTENPVRTDYNIYATPKPEVTEAPYEYGRAPYSYSADQYETDDEKAVFVATRGRTTVRPTSRATRPRTTVIATTTPAPTTTARTNRRSMPTGLNRPATRPPSTEPKAPPKPPSRPVNRYPTPAPFSTATKCNSRNCKLPDCRCGGTDIPGGIPSTDVPQVVLLTFDDAINELNYDLYEDIFTTRKNPNGCPILGTFYVSHEWTDYGKVQTMYAQGHEMASHSVTHSYGEKFSKSQWQKEINGQREILHLYGGVNLEDVRGMRAPFLQIGGNKMFEMLYESNFTYDSSMPVFENNPPFWPYTTDYAINHECMITPCPAKAFPGIWEVGMVMWIDLRGGRCSMGDACSNPTDEEGVYKMLIKNFNRHYKSNRAPFGLYYHSAWFSTQHHRKGFFRFLDEINAKNDVWLITNWQLIQWMRNPTPSSKINSFEPWQCKADPKKPPLCRNPTVCNVWDRGGVRYMKTCQPCPSKYPWVGKTGFENRG